MIEPCKGITTDVLQRLRVYSSDWTDIASNKSRILAAAVYISFASVLPALAFGEQFSLATDGIITVVNVLAATAIAGVLQAIIGGQPLLIVGVAEPIVLIYAYMYEFAKDRDDLGASCSQATVDSIPSSCLFLPWASWVCVFTAVFMFILAVTNAATYVDRFTRFSGELFGMLIALLFMQQAIQGLKYEFKRPGESDGATDGDRLVNGLWSLFLAFGLCISCLLVRQARSWRFLKSPVRRFLSDYGAPLMVIAWSGLSFAVSVDNNNVPVRVSTPDTWQVDETWLVARSMSRVPGHYIAGAILPALIIAILFYFDHSVSSQMAQQAEFNLQKPTAYHYDLLLIGVMALLMGLVGLPPVNGVLPQAPMHTKSLSKIAKKNSNETNNNSSSNTKQVVAAEGGGVVQLEVVEQRGSNLLQALIVSLCLAITPAIRQIPSAVLWGYFAFMALESLPGSQFWDRLLLLLTDPSQRYRVLEQGHAPFLETVPFKTIAYFTLLQLSLLLVVYGITWIPLAGVLFPIPIMCLVPFRQYIMPRFFNTEHLEELDAMKEELLEPLPRDEAMMRAFSNGTTSTTEQQQQEPCRGDEEGILIDSEIHGRRQMVVHHVTHSMLHRRRSLSLEEGDGVDQQP